MNVRISFSIFLIVLQITCEAQAELCNASERFCGYWKGTSRTSPASPTRGSRVRLNPSAVPLEKTLGLEAIYFDQGLDLALVKGLGRVGAAISPSNSEETFFGPPGVELPDDYLSRKQNQKKYPSQKVTLATAVGLLKNKRDGLRHFELNLGVMGKYNLKTHATTPGGGLSGVAGPLTFGYSLYSDQTQTDFSAYGETTKPITKYQVETYSLGIFLNSLAVDYSILRMVTTEASTTSVLTISLLLKSSMFTFATRKETSSRAGYNSETRDLNADSVKSEAFGGAQVNFGRNLMLGVFYNYYVLKELSLGATYFF